MSGDLREYPKHRYRRAWIVKNSGIAMQFNGEWCYTNYSDAQVGEVFFVRKDAKFVQQQERELLATIGHAEDAKKIKVQPVMIPIYGGASEHVRALRMMNKEPK